MPRPLLRLALALALAANTHAFSQTPTYDAVSIKPNKSGSGNTSTNSHADTFQATNVSIKQLLVSAYGIREGLISGLAAWAESARYDIHAKISDYDPALTRDHTPEQSRRLFQAMLAVMLEERFHVKVHTELKTIPIYELILAKDGLKLKPSPPATALTSEQTSAAPKADLGRGGLSFRASNSTVEINARAVTLSSLADSLSDMLDRTVSDKTGVTGEFDLHLRFTSDNAAQPPLDDAPPFLFTAIQEQLGLKLQPAKGPVDTLVLDHVEQPTEN